MSTVDYRVEGMTCAHCASSVGREVGAIAGVSAVSVDVTAGVVTVTGDVADADVAVAVAEAGYTMTGRTS